MRYPLVDGQGNFGNAGDDGAAAARYTECRMASLAMEMVRDIRRGHGRLPRQLRRQEPGAGRPAGPVPEPAGQRQRRDRGRHGHPDPPHNLREVAEAAQWVLAHPDATREDRLEACIRIIKGPDFPTQGLIMGRRGIEDAYRTPAAAPS